MPRPEPTDGRRKCADVAGGMNATRAIDGTMDASSTVMGHEHVIVIAALAAVRSIGCATPRWSTAVDEGAATTSAAAPTAAAEETVERLIGERRFAGGSDERARLADEIATLAEHFSFVARAIARRRLTAANEIPERIAITREGKNQLTIALDGRSYTGTLDGAPVAVTGVTGDTLTMRLTLTPAGIEQRFTGPDGGRINVFAPHDDDGMQVFVRVFSERLPDELRYVLTYRHEAAHAPRAHPAQRLRGPTSH